jgi:hypothetical protein
MGTPGTRAQETVLGAAAEEAPVEAVVRRPLHTAATIRSSWRLRRPEDPVVEAEPVETLEVTVVEVAEEGAVAAVAADTRPPALETTHRRRPLRAPPRPRATAAAVVRAELAGAERLAAMAE